MLETVTMPQALVLSATIASAAYLLYPIVDSICCKIFDVESDD